MKKPRIALVTGFGGGIGQAVATRLKEEKYIVVATDLKNDRLSKTASESGFPFFAADLGNRKQVRKLAEDIENDFGYPSVLVNSAGGVCGQQGIPLEEVSEADWHEIFRANLDSAFYLAQTFVPFMKESGWGRIVTISSGAGLRPSLTGIYAYTAAKHALVGLTKQLSQDLGQYGITVNSVAPGFIRSNPNTEKQWEKMGPDGQRKLLERIHTKRTGKPADVAAAVAFFASAQAEWISGQILSVDGGIS